MRDIYGRCTCKWCMPQNERVHSMHDLSESDVGLMQRWKAERFTTYRRHVLDDDYEIVFTDNGFEIAVPSGNGGVPVLDPDSREMIEAHLFERTGATA